MLHVTVKEEAVCSSGTLLITYEIKRRHNSEENNRQFYLPGNIKSRILLNSLLCFFLSPFNDFLRATCQVDHSSEKNSLYLHYS
jgi:hypothetical protein